MTGAIPYDRDTYTHEQEPDLYDLNTQQTSNRTNG